ncbi:MAG: hypothetical protein POELPBGB_03026 [Bacteroidia bacterium]|nr:hypothetical protein [Bacteroidia bacterium]
MENKSEQDELILFKAQHTTNEQILDGLFKMNRKKGRLFYLEYYGFDAKGLKKQKSSSRIVGDYELIIDESGIEPTYQLVKINFKNELVKLHAASIRLVEMKKENEASVWNADHTMKDKRTVEIYEERKKELKRVTKTCIEKTDLLIKDLSDTIASLKNKKRELKK